MLCSERRDDHWLIPQTGHRVIQRHGLARVAQPGEFKRRSDVVGRAARQALAQGGVVAQAAEVRSARRASISLNSKAFTLSVSTS